MKLFSTRPITDWLIAAGTLLTAATLIIAGISYQVRLRGDATASMQTDVDHEGRLRAIESVVSAIRTDVSVTKNDVSWIRAFLNRQDPHKDSPQTVSN